ncbi:hypothetical protein M0R88_18605 [Halorussus gelatinilyticus]|uniref:Uncharacterized protein n=1 Tax=Halorussus gelatinilyticus TaxID=2937524 RepID=A0A8U0II65_9EURY|nr:hypothetical protein [Halorussus gelatinilyticus]UPW00498.1 hypothetical protein M0R88_18605 [Halorussus gelatinilyticus]
MGYGGTFRLIDHHELYGHFERDYEELSSVVEATGEETPPTVREARESLGDALALVDGFSPPPTCNSFDEFADVLGWTPTLYGLTAPHQGCKLSLLTREDGRILYERVPEFIGEHSEYGAELWRKLVGRADDATYRIEVRETEYLFETDLTGFLYGSELSELAEELRPILPKTDAFYAEIVRDVGSYPDACQLRIIDAIAILCEQAGDDELLIHEFSY